MCLMNIATEQNRLGAQSCLVIRTHIGQLCVCGVSE